MGNRWLLKTEPSEYAFEDLVRERRAVWSGVTNALALKHLREIRRDDEALVYHTGTVKAAVGLARVASDPYPDPEQGNPRLAVVDMVPIRPLMRPVSLAELKADPRFRDFALVRLPRLSVMPVPAATWQAILRLAGERRP